MQALRAIKDIHEHTLTLELPEFFWKKRVEVIVLPLEDQEPSTSVIRRKPSPLLAGTRITGDLVASTCPDNEWEALQ